MKSIKTISLLIILFFFSLDSANSKSINVEINKNVETLAILYLLADVGLNQPSGYLEPLREKAKEHFWSYKNHKAVKLLNNYLVRIGVDGPIDIMMHLSPLPNPKLVNGISNRLLESISGTQDKTKGEALLNEFISAFNDFYKTAKVDDFLQEHKNYYYHVKEEVLQNLPDANFVRVMENYYGKENLSYTLIPAPILHPTCGFGVRINTKKGLKILIYLDQQSQLLILPSINTDLMMKNPFEKNQYMNLDIPS